MNLYQFEDAVSSIIVERGLEYFDAGFVAKLVSGGSGRYNAHVEGADVYEVSVQLDEEQNIVSSYCDCPFDMESVCKHEVAVYYELIHRLKDNDFPQALSVNAMAEQPALKVTLENLSKEKLIDILIKLADDDPILHNELLFTYAIVHERQEVERCKQFIETIIDKYKGREGFISYQYANAFADELLVVLHRVEKMKDPLMAVEVAGLLLIEAVQSIQYTDDSSSGIGVLIDETIKAIQTIASSPLELSDQSDLLERLILLSKHQVFEGWDDFRIDVLSICISFAANEQLRNTLVNELESMLVDSSATHYDRYGNERILNLLYDIIETYGTTEEATQFLHANLKYPSFRKRLMQYEMKEGNYENVLALASEGERRDKDYRGLVTRWKKWRYAAYKQLQSVEEQMKMGRELLMAGEFKYYWELKELAADDPSFYDDLKQELAATNNLVYVQLIEAENDVDAILEVVRESPSSVERYMKYLLDSHKDEAIHLFESHVKTMAENAFNRKEYKEVCRALRRFRKIAGKEAQLRVAEELEKTYKNRPAFLDELGKL
ncbi:hypothetical protein MHZ92_20235 [Sporosarcina sp. ACRSL]|uniref:SWIM zinc finger family protein n=1 Tax=Sporosarcina sp. ACRSL TaxID=2918215 RepID=UPI001EF5BF8E|nr:hypothetical protein [Sporosarcina sp. ACRSL]MCG7346437.1 hypothetical protein [Sporosarcina sp. ACRSL]